MKELKNKENKVEDIVNIKVYKSKAIAETQSAVLVRFGNHNIWFNKKFISASVYTNILNIGIVPSFKYAAEYIKAEEGDNKNGFFKGQVIIDFFNKERERKE